MKKQENIPARDASQRHVEETIQAALLVFAHQFPGESFDAPLWDLRSFASRPGVRPGQRFSFTRLSQPDQLLPPEYLRAVKSWIILDGHGLSDRVARFRATQVLWEVILHRHGEKAIVFPWKHLTLEDFMQAELYLLEHWAEGTAYSQAHYLKKFANFLEARRICPPLYFVPQTPLPARKKKYSHISIERQHQQGRLPSQKALEGLADIYHTYAKEPPDRLLIAALALLVVSGLRVGELLTLPLQCEVEEVHQETPRYGLRYYCEKSRGGELMLAVRWLTPIGAELARKALHEIRSITAPFRQQAVQLEQTPERVVIANHSWADKLSPKDLTRILGLKSRNAVLNISPGALPRHEGGGK